MSKQLNPERKVQIDTICNELFRAGGMSNVSVRKVLDKLPDITSTSTVNPYVSSWKSEHKQQVVDMFEQMGFSDNFKSVFFQEIQRISAVREEQHQSELASLLSDLELVNESLSRQEDELADMTHQRDTAKQEALALSHTVSELKAQHQERINGLIADINGKEARLTNSKLELDSLNTKYTELYGEVASLKSDKANLSQNLELERQHAQRLLAVIDEKDGRIKELDKQAAKLEVQNEGHLSSIQDLRGQLNQSREQQATAENELAIQSSQCQRMTEQYEATIIELSEQQEKVKEMEDQLIEATARVDVVQGNLDKANKELVKVRKSYKAMSDKNRIIERDLERFEDSNAELQRELNTLRNQEAS